MKNIGLKTKLLLWTLIPIIMLITLALVSTNGINYILSTNESVEHTHKVINKANIISTLAVDMETGMRGYLLAGREEFLQPYKQGRTDIFNAIKQLSKTVSDNPKQVERLHEIELILLDWEKSVIGPNIALRNKIGDGKTMNDLAALVGKARGKKLFDKFRKQITDFIANVNSTQKTGRVDTVKGGIGVPVSPFSGRISKRDSILPNAYMLLVSAVDMETGMRGYLLAGSDNFLNPYNEGRKSFFARLAKMKEEVGDNRTQQKLLDDIGATIVAWIDNVSTPTIALRRKIGDAKTMDDMAHLIAKAHGKKFFDNFRKIMSEFKAEELALMEKRKASHGAAITKINNALWITLIIAVTVGLGMGWRVASGVLRQVGGEPAEIELLANEVANGNFEIPFKKGDKTGILNALHQMANALNEADIKDRHELWLKNSGADLAAILRGEHSISDLSQDVCTFLAKTLQASVAAFYVAHEDGTFHLTGGFALEKKFSRGDKIIAGEGITGQAITQRKPIIIEKVPANYLQVNSGLGNSTPSTLLVFPFIRNNRVEAIVELGSVNEFTQQHKTFLEQETESIAITISVTRSREIAS
ncbi:MAG: CHASE3 domain-containing protein [Magnetococcales bacterium]|nr:CHASE3 domain-containing protein [Magnetococcales bacterium]